MLPCFNILIVCLLHELLNVHAGIFAYIFSFEMKLFLCMFTEALYDKEQTIISKDSEISKLQAQVEARTAEKDTFTTKYEAIVKESEG